MGKLDQIVFRQARQRVSAVGFLYKLCGSSQPSIIQGSDGAFYVVKFNGFPGRQGLANEVVGTELIQSAGLPAPDWAAIEVSDEFMDGNRGLWFRNENCSIRPLAGIHFGSRLVEAPEDQRTYQIIPRSWIGRIANRADFLGMLVLDLWANNCDRRQAVFLSGAKGLHACFIDNDFMFGGKFGDDITCPRRAMVHDLEVYRALWNETTVRKWLRKINGIDENTIQQIIAAVPSEWADEAMRAHISNQLETRRPLLPGLLREAKGVLGSGYSVSHLRSRNATEPCQFRGASLLPLQ